MVPRICHWASQVALKRMLKRLLRRFLSLVEIGGQIPVT